MKAALLRAPEKIEFGEIDCPAVEADEVLIQPSRVGVCGSDVSFFAGHRVVPYPHLLGHELVGRVTAVGEQVTRVQVGQRVTVEPNYPCGQCAFCRTGRGSICPNKQSMGVNVPGCLAEYVTAPAEYVWPLPDSISDEDAATIEPLCVSLRAFTRSGAQLGDTVAVLGCGATGLLTVQVAVAQGVRVLAHDKFPEKLEMARRLGAIVPSSDNGANAVGVEELWQNENVSTVFECAGATATAELALRAVPRGGQVVLIGLAPSPATFVPLRLVREGIRVTGSIIYDHPLDFGRAIGLVARGVLRPSQIVTDSLPFDSTARALQMASTGQAGKIHIEI